MDLFTLLGRIKIESGDSETEIDGMIEKAQTLSDTLNSTSTKATNASKDVTDSTQKSTSKLNAWSVALGNIYTKVGSVAWNKGKDFFQTGYEFNKAMESYAAGFKTLLGTDMEGAEAFAEKLRQFAFDTPLSLSEVMEGAKKLMATGFEADEVIDILSMLGDISLGNTAAFSRIAIAYQQIMGAQKLYAQDARQFTEAGVPIWDLLEKYYATINHDYSGMTAATLQSMDKQKYPISADDVAAALQMAVSEGGDFYNAMNTAMDTAAGQAEKLEDNYQQMAGAFVEALFNVFNSDVIESLNDTIDKFRTWAEENPDALNDIATAIGDFASINITNLSTGLISVMDTLKQITAWYGDNKELFAAIFSMAGLAVMGAHPVLGTGLITLGAGIAGVVGEERKEMLANVGHSILAQDAEGKEQSEGNGTTDVLTGLEKFVFESLGNLFPDWYVDPELLGPEKIITDDGGGFRFGEPDFYGPPLPEGWDGNTGSSSIGALLAALQTLPERIESAAQTGVANGMSGVSITGNVTTGDVRLNNGALVGALTPQLNLRLGWANKISGRDSG